jgi:hypothetical protein
VQAATRTNPGWYAEKRFIVFGCPARCEINATGYHSGVSDTALLVVDMLNAYRHEDADELADSVAEMVEPLAGLIDRARGRDDVDVIYVNDNYGDFAATRDAIVTQALDGRRPELVNQSCPTIAGRS